jgi:hypothetical protein
MASLVATDDAMWLVYRLRQVGRVHNLTRISVRSPGVP